MIASSPPNVTLVVARERSTAVWDFADAEILHDVCAYTDAAALLSLALSCKAFCETATRLLWSDIHDLSPLIKCLPEDAWATEETGELKIVRSLAPDDWASFLSHSAYVRHLGRPWDDVSPRHPTLDNEVLTSLLIYRPVLILFPRMVEFTWSTLGMYDGDLPAVLGLMGPHVKRISITGWSLQDVTEQHLQTSLSLISTRFPCLQYFYLQCEEPLAVYQLIPGALLNNLHHLRVFRCHDLPITESAFSALGRLQYLSELSIRLPALISWGPLPPNAFPLLCKITVTALTKDYFAFSATVAKFPKVDDATIALRDLPQLKDGFHFFNVISSQFSHPLLAKLSIYMSDDANYELGGPLQHKVTITRDHVRRLLSFTGLKVLGVNLACQYALDGALLTEVAKTLPEIESLHIGDFKHCIYDAAAVHTLPTMTQTLAPFATHCPNLSSLGIPFDARQNLTISDIRNAIPHRPSLSSVTYLDCSHCPIEDGFVVAAYIARVFPMLNAGSGLEFCPFPQFEWEWEYQWGVVWQRLPWFKMIREDERGETAEN